VDYGTATSFTTYGTIGVKVWLYHGDMAPKERVTGVGGERPAHGRRPQGGSDRPDRPERGERRSHQGGRSGK
jgi:small subunit ribosomal protein S3